MKYVRPAATIAATLAIGAGAAHAGNLVQPAMEPEVVMNPETVAAGAASSGGFVIPLLLLALIAAAASSSGSPLPEE